MANEGDFQDQVRQLGKLIAEFEELPESAAKVAAKQMLRLLMDIHGSGLERMMEIVFDSASPAREILDKFGQDPLLGSLLVLYSLHPDDLETRVLRAIERMRIPLRKMDCTLQLISIEAGVVQLRAKTSGHPHAPMLAELRARIEEGIYEQAPDAASLSIEGLETPPASGFVPLERLIGQPLAASSPSSHVFGNEGAD